MVMRFQRNWDFNPGNKKLMLNDLTQDSDVILALQEALTIAQTGVASQIPYSNLVSGLAATQVQAAIDEVFASLEATQAEIEGVVGGAGLNAEGVMDLLGNGGLVGDGVTLTYDDVAGTLTLTVEAAAAGLDAEGVMDHLGTTGLVAGDNITLTYDDVAGTIRVDGDAGGATTLDGLTDVDLATTAPTDGQTLVYDEALGMWLPGTISGGGGAEMGVWENDVVATFTPPPNVETNLTAAPLTLPIGRPATPTFSFTVDAGMMVASDDPELGMVTSLCIHLSIHNPTGSPASSNCRAEVEIIRLVTGTPQVLAMDFPGSIPAGQRAGFMLIADDVAVGDIVNIRCWQDTGTPGYKLDWWARRSLPDKLGKGMPEGGGRYLYRNIVPSLVQSGWIPSTTLLVAPTNWVVGSNIAPRWFDAGVEMSQPSMGKTILNTLTHGIMRSVAGSSGDYLELDYPTAASAKVGYTPCPMRLTFDRLAIPTPPA